MMYTVQCSWLWMHEFQREWTDVRAFSDYPEAEAFMWQQSFECYKWRVI